MRINLRRHSNITHTAVANPEEQTPNIKKILAKQFIVSAGVALAAGIVYGAAQVIVGKMIETNEENA